MQQNIFELHYEGNSTKDHKMDLSTLIKVMSAVNALMCSVEKKAIKSKENNIEVEVKAFKEGSFGVEFVLLGGLEFTAHHLAALIGLSAVGHGGILGYRSWCRNKKVVNITELDDEGNVEVKANDGTTINTTSQVVNLASNDRVVDLLHRIFVTPFEELDLDSIYISKDQEAIFSMKQKDAAEIFQSDSPTELLENWTMDHIVVVEQVALTEEGKWRLRLGNNKPPVTASMECPSFIEQVRNGQVTFKANDKMNVKLKKEVTLKNFRKRNSYTILEVYKHWHTGQ